MRQLILWAADSGMGEAPALSRPSIRFGLFELDTRSGEVRKGGVKLKLDGQPARLLQLLLERPGEVVTREDVKAKLWPADTFVDFDHGINDVVKRLRQALDDSADTPRYIETLPRRGYRFIYPVAPDSVAPVALPTSAPRFGRRAILAVAAVCVLVAAGTILVYVRASRRSQESPRISSLAVLPFANLSGRAEEEYFSDGMTDELITYLSKIHGVRVISRTSVLAYKSTRQPLRDIARELGVDGIVEGTVLRSADRVRITVQLIHGPSDTHLWSDIHERQLKDVLALQAEVAESIARQINATITGDDKRRMASVRVLNPQAYEFYLRGRYHLQYREVQQARDNFTRAIELDHDYANAYAGLADSYNLATEDGTPEQTTLKAEAAAGRALQLDSSMGEPHAALAWARLSYYHDWAGAEREFHRAIELNPQYEIAHFWYGCELVWLKDFDDGLAEMKRAQQIAPASLLLNAFYGMGLYQARQYDHAIEQLRATIQLDRTYPAAHMWLGLTLLAKGSIPQAVAHLEEAVRLSRLRGIRESAAISRLGYAYAVAGQKKQALAMLQELDNLEKLRYVPAIHRAVVHIGLGHKEIASRLLEQAYDEHAFELALINVDPRFDSLRADGSFQRLLRKMNFPR